MSADSDPEFNELVDGKLPEEYDFVLEDDNEVIDENYIEDDDDFDPTLSEGEEESMIGDDDLIWSKDIRSEDQDELKTINEFMSKTCGCKRDDSGNPCSSRFTTEDFLHFRAEFLEFTKEQQDVYLLSLLRSHLAIDNETAKFSPRMKGRDICMNTFLALHAIGRTKFYNNMQHYKLNKTIVPRTHGNSGRLPINSVDFGDSLLVKNFLMNYAEDFAIPLPGSYPSFRNFRVMVLDCSKTKASVYEVYRSLTCRLEKRCVGFSKFRELWNQLVPYIVIGKPRTDLCDVCQRNNTLIGRTVNKDDAEKLARVCQQEEHLLRAERERFFYKQQCLKANECIKDLPEEFRNSQYNKYCSFKGVVHISFDYAQQLHIPSNPMQPGPIYFLTPRKCGLFGICAEGLMRQINYLIDEGMFIGKGPNAIISFVHHYCEKYGLGETDLDSHADNCVGQNKNNPFIWYWLWRILTGRHNNISYNFMIAGHTKFSCDRGFGLIKKVTKRTFISSLVDIAQCVNSSSPNKVTNRAEFVGLENGHQFVTYYDWKTFLAQYFVTLPEIIKYHHFEFKKEFKAGDVKCYVNDNSPADTYNILKKIPPKDAFPSVIQPKGLSKKRKDYLAKEIRQFCKSGTEYLIAPLRQHEK